MYNIGNILLLGGNYDIVVAILYLIIKCCDVS